MWCTDKGGELLDRHFGCQPHARPNARGYPVVIQVNGEFDQDDYVCHEDHAKKMTVARGSSWLTVGRAPTP